MKSAIAKEITTITADKGPSGVLGPIMEE